MVASSLSVLYFLASLAEGNLKSSLFRFLACSPHLRTDSFAKRSTVLKSFLAKASQALPVTCHASSAKTEVVNQIDVPIRSLKNKLSFMKSGQFLLSYLKVRLAVFETFMPVLKKLILY